MAIRRKSIEYWFPHLATVVDAVDTSFTQITVDLPESAKTFRSVTVEITAADVAATLANVTGRNVDIQLAAAGYTASDNAQTWTQSGENFSVHYTQDFTSYFTTNWSGTSMTMDCRININTSVSGCRNASAKVTIDYDYEDTSTTHIKTVRIPLNAPLIALATTKPGAATAVIPDLSTYCPETNKTFLQTAIVVQGNTESAGTIDMSISQEIDTAGVLTSGLYEMGAASAYSYRQAHLATFTTNATHNYFIWASVTDFDHPQVWMVVTYTFDAPISAGTWAASTAYSIGDRRRGLTNNQVFRCTTAGTSGGSEPSWSITPLATTNDNTAVWTAEGALNSLMLPMEFGGPMGTSASLYNRATRQLWIQEPGTITTQTCALFVFYEQAAAIAGLNARIGTGSFNLYSSVGTTACGSMMLMIRNDSITLARGRNSISTDIYNTDTADPGAGLSSFWLINYHSGVASEGIGAHNHTVVRNLVPTGNAAVNSQRVSASVPVNIPEASYFLNAIGVEYVFCCSSTTNPGGCYIGVERLAAGEGGFNWEHVYEAMNASDPEQSIRWAYGTARSVLTRFPGDQDGGGERLNLETARRWVCSQSLIADHVLNLMLTYHAILYTVSGTISDSNGGNVDIFFNRVTDREHALSTSRTGNGAYSFTWYDDTEEVFVSAYEAATYHGRSKRGLQATDFNISLYTGAPGGGGSESAYTFVG